METTSTSTTKTKKKIFVFCNNKNCNSLDDWHNIAAVSEDGDYLAGHICSNHYYAYSDMGFTSEWKHDIYNKALGEGNWKLEWVTQKDFEKHDGFALAMKRALDKSEKEKETIESVGPGLMEDKP